MEQLETEFGKDNCPSCPLAYHLGTSFILKIAESTRPAVDCMQTLCPGSALTEIRQLAVGQCGLSWRPWVQFGGIWTFVGVN